jgi:hypothetical protein
MQGIIMIMGRDSSVGLATGWTVRGSNTGGGEIFRTRPDRPWGPPSLLYNGHRVFPGRKAAFTFTFIIMIGLVAVVIWS